MNRWLKIVSLMSLMVLIFGSGPVVLGEENAVGEQDGPLVSPEVYARIEAATPSQGEAKPSGRKLLVFSGARGYRHSSIPVGAAAFEIMGRKTKAFEAVLSSDIAMFEPETLKQFDAVVMNNTTGDIFLPPVEQFNAMTPEEQAAAREYEGTLKSSLLSFVSEGGGLVGIHSATDCYYEWTDYGKMIGAYFWGHPWWYGQHRTEKNELVDTPPVVIRVDEPKHPLVASMAGKSFEIRDEIYQFKAPYARERVRVLLSLDPEATAKRWGGMASLYERSVRRRDGDFAVSWIREYKKGRVFYCSLGHSEDVFSNPVVLKHYLSGIQYALGDLKADATPSAIEKETWTLKEAWKALPTYDARLNFSRKPLSTIAAQVTASKDDPAARAKVAAQLAALLGSDATSSAKTFVCRQLSLIGGSPQVPALAPLLTNPELSHIARYALARIPGNPATAALVAALDRLDPIKKDTQIDPKQREQMKIGILNSLGDRGDVKGIAACSARLTDGKRPESIRMAAAAALGKIGGNGANLALSKAFLAEESASLHGTLAEALLVLADRMVMPSTMWEERVFRDMRAVAASNIYTQLYVTSELLPIRMAALHGIVVSTQAKSIPLLIEALKGDNAKLQTVAAGWTALVPGDEPTKAFAELLPELDEAGRRVLVATLGTRGNTAARDAVLALTKDEDASVRFAAITAAGQLGDASTALRLATLAADSKGAERTVARNALNRLRGKTVDARIESDLKAEEKPAIQGELIRSLAARGATSAVGTLFAMAGSDSGVTRVRFKALGDLTPPEHRGRLVAALVALADETARTAAEKALVSCCLRLENPDQATEEVIHALPAETNTVRGSLLRVLGKLGGKKGLAALRPYLTDKDMAIQSVAIRTLSNWPDAAASADLWTVASTIKNERFQVLALRGYIRLASLREVRPESETLAMFARVLKLSDREDVIKLVLGGLSKVTDPAALAIAVPLLKHKTLKEETVSAVVTIAESVSGFYGYDAIAAVQKALAATEKDDLRQQAERAIESMEKYAGHITAWETSGPYVQESLPDPEADLSAKALFAHPFPPEMAGDGGDQLWWTLSTRTDRNRPWVVNLNPAHRHSPRYYRRCVGYVRTQIWSANQQNVLLEIGSNQPVVVWLNGQAVYRFDEETRAHEPHDTEPVVLKKGWNRLKIKMLKDRGGWATSARFTALDGSALEGLRCRSGAKEPDDKPLRRAEK